jgi:hypothetical protein
VIKQNAISPCNGILFSHREKEILVHTTAWINLENIIPMTE